MNSNGLIESLAMGAILALGIASASGSQPDRIDDFPRERGGATDELKDSLEGHPPPALEVRGWMNGDPQTLASLRGKVVLLKFWGVW
jgi:hypothetical protein